MGNKYVAVQLVGRGEVVGRVLEVLNRPHYGAAVIIAPRGSGKTAVLNEVARRLGGAQPAPFPWGRCGGVATPSGAVLIDEPKRHCGVDSAYWLARAAVKRGLRYVVTTSDPRVAGLAGYFEILPMSTIVGMWNMARGEFEELYYIARGQYPGAPPFGDVWAVAGGNPKLLFAWAKRGWSLVRLTLRLMAVFGPAVQRLVQRGFEEDLARAVEDPDECGSACNALWLSGLMSAAFIARPAPSRELGVGRYFGWTAPLFKDIVAKILNG